MLYAGPRLEARARPAAFLLLAISTLAGATGCATATNYLDPEGPVYRGEDLHDVGNAVLSPWPIEESWKLLLPHRSRILKQGRAAVAARIRVVGRPLRVYALQLGSPFGVSGGARKRQAEGFSPTPARAAIP